MVVLKVIQNSNGGLKYLENCIRYLKHDKDDVSINLKTGEKTYGIREDFVMMHGINVSYDTWEQCYSQMLVMKRHYEKEDYNPVIHCVVCFDKSMGCEECKRYCLMLERCLGNEYQLVWGLHRRNTRVMISSSKWERCETYHVHIIMNSVNLKTKRMEWVNKSFVHKVLNYVNLICDSYVESYLEYPDNGKVWRVCSAMNHDKK